jgi:hypothetical protein
MSSRVRQALRHPVDGFVEATRRGHGRRLGYEAKKVRASGTEVVLIQPTEEDLAIMGRNWMSRQRRHDVIEKAIRTVGEQLEQDEIADAISGLPEGEPHKIERPAGPPSTWPPIVPAVRRERAA